MASCADEYEQQSNNATYTSYNARLTFSPTTEKHNLESQLHSYNYSADYILSVGPLLSTQKLQLCHAADLIRHQI